MNKTVISIIITLVVVVGGAFALYRNPSADNTMMKENEAMKPATTSVDAMMKDSTNTTMASATPAMMGDEKKDDAMMSQ